MKSNPQVCLAGCGRMGQPMLAALLDAGFAALDPLFRAMGAHIHPMGQTGAGMTAKGLNNLIAASSTAMTRLALDWVDDAGLEPRAFLNLVHSSSGQNWFASGFDTIEFARDGYTPDNTIGILKKDVESALDAAPEDADTALPQAVLRHMSKLKPRRTP